MNRGIERRTWHLSGTFWFLSSPGTMYDILVVGPHSPYSRATRERSASIEPGYRITWLGLGQGWGSG